MTDCPGCNGRGLHDHPVPVEGPVAPTPEEIVAEHVALWAEARLDEWRRIVPARFALAVVGDLPEPVRAEVAAWVLGPRDRNLVLCGPVGTGKSHAAAAAAFGRYSAGQSVAWWSVARLMDAMRPGDPDRAEVGRSVLTVDVLVLDDLAAEKPTEWTRERLDLIMDARWAAELPTIVTTNATPAALREVLDARFVSRLADGALVLTVTGPDRRKADR